MFVMSASTCTGYVLGLKLYAPYVYPTSIKPNV